MEKILFRLIILIAFCSICIGTGLYIQTLIWLRENGAEQREVENLKTELRERCTNDHTVGVCSLYDRDGTWMAKLFSEENRLKDRQNTLIFWALVGSFGLAIVFYAIRWITTGRFKPLWILGNK